VQQSRSHFRIISPIVIGAVFLTGCLTQPTETVQPTTTREQSPSGLSSASPVPTQTAALAKPAATATFTPTWIPQETPTKSSVIPQVTDFDPNVPFILYAPGAGIAQGSNYEVPARDSQQTLYRIAVDGSGWDTMLLPMGGYITDSDWSVSPDGHWLVYYTGSAGDPNHPNSPFDLAIHLLNLQTGRTLEVTKLLSPDFPDNFSKLAGLLSSSDVPTLVLPGENLSENQWWIFKAGIYSKEWSPDSRRLAFAGEMDGPSSDLYLYDVEKMSIQRLTDGYGHIQWIRFSPDGKWIAHRSTNYEGEGVIDRDIYAVSLDGSIVRNLTSLGKVFSDWIAPDHALILDYPTSVGLEDLQEIRLSDGQTNNLWKDNLNSFAYDPVSGTMAISQEYSESDLYAVTPIPHGIFLTNLRTNSQPRLLPGISADSYDLFYWNAQKFRFIALGNEKSLGIQEDGTVQTLGQKHCNHASTSPDHRWLMICSDQGEDLIDLVSPEGQIVQTDKFGDAYNKIWSPDSRWFMIQQERQIWVDDPVTGKRTLVFEQPGDGSIDSAAVPSDWGSVVVVAPKN
jgi:hypothetical protein